MAACSPCPRSYNDTLQAYISSVSVSAGGGPATGMRRRRRLQQQDAGGPGLRLGSADTVAGALAAAQPGRRRLQGLLVRIPVTPYFSTCCTVLTEVG